jgi:isoleucyl-tRNA synthetase
MTLYTALVTTAKAAAPMIPFMAESIYRNLVCNIDSSAKCSVHLCDFPAVQTEWIDKKLEADMDEVLNVVTIGRACRNTANIKNRQPIGRMFVKGAPELDTFYEDIILDELNVKAVEFTDDVRAFSSYSFKPQMRTLGPKYGKLLGAIRSYLAEVDGNAAMDALNETGELKFELDGTEVVLTKEDVLIDIAQVPGFVSESDNGIMVVLDTNLTPELLEEGMVREIISKIQTMRKEAGFEVMDHITIYQSGNDTIGALLTNKKQEICGDVLADQIITGETKGYVKEWNINGEQTTLGVEKIS